MSNADDHRARSQALWREVMQAEPPAVADPYLAHYGGWPAGTTAYGILRDALTSRPG
jgi:hypothetical protein